MPALEISRVSKRYRNGTLANDSLDFSVEAGEVFALLGPNGAGKTTLVRQVLGLLRPTTGAIRLDGVDIVRDPAYARRNVGFLPQAQFNQTAIRVHEVIEGVGALRGLSRSEARSRCDDLIEQLDLGPFRKTPMIAASGGVRRLAGVAAAAVGGCRHLVLDEPTNDIDPLRRQLLWNMLTRLRREGTTILLVTHNLAEAERVIDRFAIIDRGRILRQGAPRALRSLVTDRLRLELTGTRPVEPHPALTADPQNAGAFLFRHEDLVSIGGWLDANRRCGAITDFRIGPPTLDDIYAWAVGAASEGAAK